MNHDDHTPDLQPHLDPELEARIVAWVAGEASAFEIAELTRLIGEKPELGIFKRRIEAVHGLVGEAVRPDHEPLQLSAERRAKLLQTLGAPNANAAQPADAKIVSPDFTSTKKFHRNGRQWFLAIAACLTVGFFTFLSIPVYRQHEDKMAETANLEQAGAKPRDIENRFTIDQKKRKESTEDAEHSEKAAVERLAQVSKDELSASAAKRWNGLDKTNVPPVASTRFYYEAPSSPASRSKTSFAESAKQLIGRSSAVALNNSVRSGGYLSTSSAPPKAEVDSQGSSVSDDGKLVLTPFEVTASNDQGYAASSTLAGTRIRTELKDIGSPITVVTKEFLADVSAGNSAAPLQYAPRSDAAAGKPAPAIDALLDSPAQSAASLEKKSGKTERDDDLPLAPSPQTPVPTVAPVETSTAKEPVSTFSLHVSDVSFRLAQAALAANESIDPARIRPEEFYNAFNYGDPTPSLAEKVSCRIEQTAHPFLQQRNLVRIAVKVAASGRDTTQPLHLTILLDTSGSMERDDRVAIVQRAMATLVSLLGANDRITLIGFARQPSLLAESIAGDQSKQILDLIAHVPPEDGTNLEEALKLGGELARRQFEATAQNRIVLLTDGAANLGNANPAQLSATIEKLRQQGIAFDACGVGFDGLDDSMLENLTRKGDGRYYVLNSPEAADAGFAHQLAGAFRPAAENVKLQVRFNPTRVGHYRLIGFEHHRLREEDFRNDKVDAAELAAEEAAVAVYQVEPLPQGDGDLGEVFVRFRDAASGNMVERSWTLSYDPQAPAFDRATPSMQLAGVAALLAEKLRGGPVADAIKLGDLAPVINTLRSHYASEPRVQELITMFGQLRQRTGE
ncbi:MAG TPA: von Willebrand factor type A domain-containing protein [Lacunisphaera sp.]|jgi:Mg-chelatase subunit ChlD